MSALLDVMTDAHTKSAERQQEPEQVGRATCHGILCLAGVLESKDQLKSTFRRRHTVRLVNHATLGSVTLV